MRRAEVQDAQGRAACGWHERVKRVQVLGAVGREPLPKGLGRADSPHALLSRRRRVGSGQPSEGPTVRLCRMV